MTTPVRSYEDVGKFEWFLSPSPSPGLKSISCIGLDGVSLESLALKSRAWASITSNRTLLATENWNANVSTSVRSLVPLT
ncbi:MAG: hypothetical protein BWY99_02515 [Synergistetes bacterium ADurb.BinA166]|nr:MAG: hypothetical protein BWY99_02515 [Synergistetes bacterium ADurb.BinA166]